MRKLSILNRPQYWYKVVCYEWVRPRYQVQVAHRYDLPVEVMLPMAAVGLLLALFKANTLKNIFHHLSPQCVLKQRMQSWVEGVNDLLSQKVGGRLNRDQIDEAGFNFSFELYRNMLQYILERKPRHPRPLVLWHWTSDDYITKNNDQLNNSSCHQRANVLAWRQRLTLITWLENLSGSSW